MIFWLKGSAMPRPMSRATRLRTMRTRSSPRCSMNGILSVTDAMSLPALDEVPERADAAPGLEAAGDRRRDVALGLGDGIGQRAAEGQPGRDGRRQGAAGAVRVRRIETRRLEAMQGMAVPEDVGGRVLEVSALDEHGPGTQRVDSPRHLGH